MSRYQKLETVEKDEVLTEECSTNKCRCSSRTRNILPWIWCSICTVVAVLAVTSSSLHRSSPPQERMNHPNDFLSAPEVPYVEKYFYNHYDFNPSSHILEFNDTGVERLYAGYPSKEIDDAWGELLKDTYMAISKDEEESVRAAAPWDLEPLDGQVYMEVGVYHNLHCLDLVRRALEPDHYDVHTDFTAQLDDKYKRVHIYHCVDQLRQQIQCHSDLTPVPLFSVEGPQKRFYATHGVAHTCRDFDSVKKWKDERNAKATPFDWSAWSK